MPTRIYRKELRFWNDHPYALIYWKDYDFENFRHIICKKKTNGRVTYPDVIIMADTETSRKREGEDCHVVAWSIAFRAFSRNICTLYGQRPRELAEMFEKLTEYIAADEIQIFWHNLSYDWVYVRKFMFERFGFPADQLNTKPLYPLYIKFENGIIFKDSLILAQRSLERWADDLQVDHRKAVGCWDYEKTRNQSDELTPDELLYIENDVLAGVECIDTTLQQIHKNIGCIPYTATGIVRGECRDISKSNRGRDWFLRIQNEEYEIQKMLERCFHGGFTHNNRYYTDEVTNGICEDFSSSYPFEMVTRPFPGERFWRMSEGLIDPKVILKNKEEYAFIFRMSCTDVDLLDLRDPMPSLLYSSKVRSLNAVVDNGRILKADYIECEMNEQDLELFIQQYTFNNSSLIIEECYASKKEYLPKWLTDYVFERYNLKCRLKHTDPVLYQIEKAKLNSIFGMSAQKPCRAELIEDYVTGLYNIEDDYDEEAQYKKWREGRSSFLPYSIGVWVTAYAMADLFELGRCVASDGAWLYSDTDSVYATAFDEKKLERFNQRRRQMLIDRGYGPITVDGEVFTLGEATTDGIYDQFKALHSKCYITHNEKKGLKITVAGVPKKGVEALEGDIDRFKIGFIFPGTISGKLQHEHHFIDKIYIDQDGNETGDSISLSPCDYMIKPQDDFSVEDVTGEEVIIQKYDEII